MSDPVVAPSPYCDVERLKESMPNNLFVGSSLVTEIALGEFCEQIAGKMDTMFLAHSHEVPLTDDYIDDLLDWPTRGGGGDPPGDRIMRAVQLANIYGVRQLVYSALATDDDEESRLAEMNGDLYTSTMNDIIAALSGQQSRGVTRTRRRDPIVRLRDEGLW